MEMQIREATIWELSYRSPTIGRLSPALARRIRNLVFLVTKLDFSSSPRVQIKISKRCCRTDQLYRDYRGHMVPILAVNGAQSIATSSGPYFFILKTMKIFDNT
ncbi:hypothetical protein CC77DRAFT_205210 [Alternaria alternata]|jgi:hypothetical protein|uniref:Uncharacterized protein n=1 Tax=Alternaria alternata TaxID=5599 RepID=A0A177DHI4_ALTAL|nr:hypothetical protein CC77DRAFT_205210 [Alternaria alternata]OAG18660.1 hypothetical protein CC77DRAFT_205210 [Alternaria alternata]